MVKSLRHCSCSNVDFKSFLFRELVSSKDSQLQFGRIAIRIWLDEQDFSSSSAQALVETLKKSL
jgi:hypothetical protein